MIGRISFILLGAAALTLAPAAVGVKGGPGIEAHAQGASGGRGEGRGGGNGHGGAAGESRGGMGGGFGHGRDPAAPGLATSPGLASKATTLDRGSPQTLGGFFAGMMKNARGLGRHADENRGATRSALAREQRASPPSLAERQQAALRGRKVAVPQQRPEDRNFRAKLAGLNSLNRNYNAYLNARDPKFAAVQAYVLTSAEYEIAVDDLATLQERRSLAEAELDALTTAIETFDEFAYADVTKSTIESRLAELESIDPASLTAEEAALVDAEIAALNVAMTTEAFQTLVATSDEQANLEATIAEKEAMIGEDDLAAALTAVANENRLAEYGEHYVDREMLDWANGLLGVGDEVGRIDEVRDAIKAGEESSETAIVE